MVKNKGKGKPNSAEVSSQSVLLEERQTESDRRKSRQ